MMVAMPDAQHFDDELIALARAVADRRDADIAVRHWRWDGGPAVTCDELARLYCITPERVERIVKRVHFQLRTANVSAPLTRRAIPEIVAALPTTAAAFPRMLTEHGLSARSIPATAVKRACGILGMDDAIRLETVEGIALVLPGRDAKAAALFARQVQAITEAAARLSQKPRVARIADVRDYVATATGVELDADRSVAVISQLDGCEWIDEAGGWFWLRDEADEPVLDRARRRIQQSGPLPLRDVHLTFAVNPTPAESGGPGEPRPLPDHIVARLLELSGVFAIDEGLVTLAYRLEQDDLATE